MDEIETLLLTCMEQKLLQLTRFADLTKQLEARCGEEGFNADEILRDRKTAMDRVDKCNALLKSTMFRLPETAQITAKAAISGQVPGGSPEWLSKLSQLALHCREQLESAAEDDRAAREKALRLKDEAAQELARVRTEMGAPTANGTMFRTL